MQQVTELVAISIPGGPKFVDAVTRVWNDGNAFCVLDARLPKPEATRHLAALGATLLLDETGLTTITANPDLVPLQAGDALVLATSGSTGEPKAVIHTHDSIRASAEATSAALAVDPTIDRWLACLPLSHIGGLSVVLRSLVTGCPVDVHPRFDAAEVERAGRQGATLVSLVTKALSQVNPKLFRTILTGGAAPPATRPTNVVATYGMTETGSGIVYDQTPIAGAELIIDDGGDILVRGPMLFRGYRDLADPFEHDGWFRTGDHGRWAPTGELVVEGRTGDVIVTGGEKVWPARTEAILRRIPEIDDAVVVGVTDPDWGQLVVAVITIHGSTPPSIDAIRSLVTAELPVWYAPKQVEVRDSFVRSPLGKILRNEIGVDGC